MRDFDALMRECRRKKMRLWLRWGTLAAVAVLFVGGMQWYMQSREETTRKAANGSSPRHHAATPQQNAPSVVKKTPLPQKKSVTARQSVVKPVKVPEEHMETVPRSERYVEVLQFVVSKKKYRSAVLRQKSRLERMGLSCYIKSSDDGRTIYLRCVPPRDLLAMEKRLAARRIDYFFASESERFLREKGIETSRLAQAEKPAEPEWPAPLARKKEKKVSPKEDVSVRQKRVAVANREPSIPPKKVDSPIIKVRSIESVETLRQRFERFPKYETALRIARLYYEKKQFDEASRWARQANALNRDDEKAWILYAEAEYAMGNRERAERILRLFLDYKDSSAARALLSRWSKP